MQKRKPLSRHKVHMTKNCESVHFLNLLYDHKDYTSFDNASSIIMKNFPEPIGLQTNTSLEDGNKSEISNWEIIS